MNLEDIQDTAKTLLDAHAGLTGVTILKDDGTYPQTPGRETALSTDGLVVVVWEVAEGSKRADVRSRQRNIFEAGLPISIDENRKVNNGTGLGIHSDKVVSEILKALAGKPAGDPFEPTQPAWANFGDVDGLRQRIMNFTVQSVI